MSKEALKLALEALEAIGDEFVCRATHHKKSDQHGFYATCPNAARHQQAITAIREALAEQEPEYVKNDGTFTDDELMRTNALLAVQHYCPEWVYSFIEMDYASHAAAILRIKELEQPAQKELVGYWQGEFSEDGGATLYEVAQVSYFGRTYPNIPLYTSPQPSKSWVGLTDEDIGDEFVRFELPGGFNRFEYAVRAIEAKLKEKNT